MSVATHLGIDLAEYDARIRTFIPHYEEMLDVAAAAINPGSRIIVDLGIGTGALAARCLKSAPQARIVGIDADAEVLKAAAHRLPAGSTFVCSSFMRATIPECDAVVASFSLHHVRTRRSKAKLYSVIAQALRPGGQLVTVDCQPASNATLSRRQFEAWKMHLMRVYSEAEAGGYLEAWSHEDVYVPMDAEMELMQRAGFFVDVLWRRDAFAVVRGKK
jgi:ubiquinone/menaquinone biosynthesis C-methylase UbiE